MLPMEKGIPFRDLILGAPHIGAYVREVFLYHRVSQEDHDRAMSDTSMLAWFSREQEGRPIRISNTIPTTPPPQF